MLARALSSDRMWDLRAGPVGKSEFARDHCLCVGKLKRVRGSGEPLQCIVIAGASSFEQVLRQLLLLFEVEAESGWIDHHAIPFSGARVRLRPKRDRNVPRSLKPIAGAALSADVDAPIELVQRKGPVAGRQRTCRELHRRWACDSSATFAISAAVKWSHTCQPRRRSYVVTRAPAIAAQSASRLRLIRWK